HPDIFAFQIAQTFRKFLDWLFDKLKSKENFLRWLAREGVVLSPGKHVRRGLSLFHKLQAHVVRLPSEENRIDRLPELAHPVVAGGRRSIQPINRAIFARDESIGAGSDVDDDFSFAHSR